MYIIYSDNKYYLHYTSYDRLILNKKIINTNMAYEHYLGRISNIMIVIMVNNKVIVSDEYYSFNLKIIKKCKLYNNKYLIYYASYYGYTNVLEWLKNSGLPLKYYKGALNRASQNGQVAVLEWWKNSGLPLKYSEKALEYASQVGHINVLEWWKNSGLELKYSDRSIKWAAFRWQSAVIEWWKNSGLKLKSKINFIYFTL
uniref:Ankyrin repeat protein n=1 Tax=viral metagenome TaxID=1070528 RepID=A0A6C0E8B3_9ZZZZ